jgi:hypothetical protein
MVIRAMRLPGAASVTRAVRARKYSEVSYKERGFKCTSVLYLKICGF